MRKVTSNNYRKDPYYPRVARAVHEILQQRRYVAPIELFIELGMLKKESVAEWRAGRIPYIEHAIQGSLPKCSRILRILAFHSQFMGLKPSQPGYIRKARGGRSRLRFSKYGDLNLEDAYSRHFVSTWVPPATPQRIDGVEATVSEFVS